MRQWGRKARESAYAGDKEGNWQTSHSFNTEDLLALAKLADQAPSRILELRQLDVFSVETIAMAESREQRHKLPGVDLL